MLKRSLFILSLFASGIAVGDNLYCPKTMTCTARGNDVTCSADSFAVRPDYGWSGSGTASFTFDRALYDSESQYPLQCIYDIKGQSLDRLALIAPQGKAYYPNFESNYGWVWSNPELTQASCFANSACLLSLSPPSR